MEFNRVGTAETVGENETDGATVGIIETVGLIDGKTVGIPE